MEKYYKHNLPKETATAKIMLNKNMKTIAPLDGIWCPP